MCKEGCAHGSCILPGICSCEEGWKGLTCAEGEVVTIKLMSVFDTVICTDVNECLDQNGGCEQKCINIRGSFHCECEPEMTLLEDKKTCRDSECNITVTFHGVFIYTH